MPSSLGHAVAALAFAPVLPRAARGRRALWLGALCAALPDVDALGRPFGRGDVAWLGGHRALSHALLVAAGVAVAVVAAGYRGSAWRGGRRRLWTYFALVTASHGALDTLTTYGEGVALLAPASWARVTAPWRPLTGLGPEVALLWAPGYVLLRRERRRSGPARPGARAPTA